MMPSVSGRFRHSPPGAAGLRRGPGFRTLLIPAAAMMAVAGSPRAAPDASGHAPAGVPVPAEAAVAPGNVPALHERRAPLRIALSLSAAAAGQEADWRALLERPGFTVRVVPESPAEPDLAETDVVMVTGDRPADHAVDSAVLAKAGRGLVVVDDFVRTAAAVPALRSGYGAAAEPEEGRSWAGEVPLFFPPGGRAHPVTAGISNFQVAGGFPWNLELDPAAEVLASTWTPHRKKLKNGEPQPYVYGVSPVLWALEKEGRRTVGLALEGTSMLENPALRTMLVRALAWTAGHGKPEVFCTADELGSLLYPPGGPQSPEAALAGLQLHPDFTAAVTASEPLVSKVVNVDWDGQNRLWVAESLEYPEGRRAGGAESMPPLWQRDTEIKPPPPATRPGRDLISRLEDTDGDGRMDRKHVFADGLDLVTSFCFYKDGVIAAQPPEVLWLRDTDGDGRADRREVLYTGLGTQDTHAVLNNLRWGLDGWIYATHGYSGSRGVTSGDGLRQFGAVNSGVVRFRPDGSAFEMHSAKNGNCWGVEQTADGTLFFTQPTSGDLLMHVPVPDRLMAEGGMGREPSWKVLIHLRPVKPLMTREEIVENQPNDVIGSFTAACGAAVYEGGSWPAEWNYSYFTCEPTVNIVHHEVLTPEGVTFRAATAEGRGDTEFSATRDLWHRPIDSRMGPDGDLYITDFYNQAILHNDPRGPVHLWNNQAARPDRDHFFGRIHRIRHKNAAALPAADLAAAQGRIAALSHPNRALRLRAQRLLEEESPEQLALAAGALASAEGPARLHALWLRAAARALTESETELAVTDPALPVRLTVARVLAEHPALATPAVTAAIARRLAVETDAGARLQLLAAVPPARALPPPLLVALAGFAEDTWTRAALYRNAKGQAAEVLQAAIAAPAAHQARMRPLIEMLVSFHRADGARLADLIRVLAAAPRENSPLAAAALQSLGRAPFAGGEKTRSALNLLLETAAPAVLTAALPLVAQDWTEAERLEKLPAAAARAMVYVEDAATSTEERTAALAALGRLPLLPPVVAEALARETGHDAVLAALTSNPAPDAVRLLLEALKSMAPQARARTMESLLGRPASALALLEALDSGRLALTLAGPSALARLQDHPDPGVQEKAASVAARLRGASEARDAIIARLLPEVSRPGNPEAGRALFAACAVCHQFRGEGAAVGPVLDGIGIHSTEVLLTHLIDPNREVEPGYLSWLVTGKSGESHAGMISRETAGSLFLKHAGGEVEVPRDSIASQTNLGISLMPEGFESMGAEPLRDIIAYLQSGNQRFHAITFGRAATADGSRGVYLAPDVPGDRVSVKKYGLAQVHGVPFSLPDPAGLASGKNVIVLRGGMEERALSRRLPARTELPVNQPAGRLHLLGAVAGWGWPAYRERETVVRLTVHYADGEVEGIDLVNGVDFADHAGPVDVPGSARTDLVATGQMRYLWRDLKRPGTLVEKLTLEGFNRPAAPMIAALTMESPGHDGTLAPPPATGGPAPAEPEEPQGQ